MNNEERMERMSELLTEALSPTQLKLQDDSHLHAGHEGAKGGLGHFTVFVYADCFRDQTLIARHKMIYKALGGMMDTDIHALSIKAYTPEEAD